ncbi:MAG: hypothetical protein PHI68_00505 [Candidatus Cloacimonetes bacterium]|nr:hypothetical protein [Candidatus Cloacimonadota bacterium]
MDFSAQRCFSPDPDIWKEAYKIYTSSQILNHSFTLGTHAEGVVTVKGKLYQTSLDLSLSFELSFDCTCGAKGVCAHTLALFFPLTEHQIGQAIDQGRHQEAREICLYVLSQAENCKLKSLYRKYSNLLANVAARTDDLASQRLILENRFIRMGYTITDFRNLKALYSQDEWGKVIPELLGKALKDRSISDSKRIDLLLKLLLEEKLYQEAVNILRNNLVKLDSFSSYVRLLPLEYVPQILHTYQDLLISFGSKLTRDKYPKLINHLKALKALESGKQALTFLLSHFSHQFQDSKSFQKLIYKNFKQDLDPQSLRAVKYRIK